LIQFRRFWDTTMHTRYTVANVFMLLFGLALLTVAIPLTGMIFGFGENPLRGVRLLSLNLAVLCIVLALPGFATAIRWPSISARMMQVITLLCVFFGSCAWMLHMLLTPLVALGISCLLTSQIVKNSQKPSE